MCVAAVLLAAALVGCTVGDAAPEAPPQARPAASDLCDIETSGRLVAIGDVHGAYGPFVDLLQHVGVIDADLQWAGGTTTLLQLGDVLHRGPDSRRVLDLLMQLEPQAAAAGGRVIALLGNHEVMRMMRDLRYVSAGEYAAFESPQSELLREAFYRQLLDEAPARARAAGRPFDEAAFRRLFLEQVPLGFVEMQAAFEETGEYGSWLRTRGAMARVNGVMFLHGGISPEMAARGCDAINADIGRELGDLPGIDDPRAAGTLVTASSGPLWYRGLALDDSPIGDADLGRILDQLRARAIVVGHTPTDDGRVRARYDGRVVQIDTGMINGTFYPNGRPSALEIRGDTVTAIYPDRRDELFSLRPAGR